MMLVSKYCALFRILAMITALAMQAAAQRPNFIFVITDDQRRDALGVEQGERAQYFIEREYPNTPTFLAVRTQHAKLVKYPGREDWTELFDLDADPYETRNLFGHPEHAPLLSKMTVELERLSKELAYQVPPHADKADFNPKDPY